ncbi:hypothetical protein ACMA5I_04200 [Paracoccaceae bacterium GXU_MW_L88]
MPNAFQEIFDRQKSAFETDRSKSREWRLDQLNRMERMLRDHQEHWGAALHEDFGKLPFEQLFEITVPVGNITYYRDNLDTLMEPEEVPLPEGLAKLVQRGASLSGSHSHLALQCADPPAAQSGDCGHRSGQSPPPDIGRTAPRDIVHKPHLALHQKSFSAHVSQGCVAARFTACFRRKHQQHQSLRVSWLGW